MESNNNYFIMVTIDWHRVACIAYFVLRRKFWSVSGISTLKQLMLHEKSWSWS